MPTTLEQKKMRVAYLQRKIDRLCLSMESGKISALEADDRFVPLSAEKIQLSKEIREDENSKYMTFLNSLKGGINP